jgi:hypothetical protein
MSATYDLAQRLTSPVQTMLAQQERLRATVMQSSGPSATIGRAAEFYRTDWSVAKRGGVCEPFGFAKSLDAYRGVAPTVRDRLAEHDRLISSFGSPATVAGGADIYGKLGSVAKTGRIPDTIGVTKPWQSRAGVASAVRDTLAEQRRMQDRMMKSLGPSATVADGADVFATAGLVAKGSVVGESFGFAKSLDTDNAAADIRRVQDTLAAQERMREKLMGYDTVATQSAAAAYGTLGSATGVGGYGPGFGRVPTIADSASFLTDVRGLARITDEISRLERSFAIPSTVTDMARTLAGSVQMAGTVRGVDPFTGLAVPMGIGGYPSMSGVVAGQAMPAGGPTEPTLIVPNAAESALLLDWLRDRAPTPQQAATVCDALNGLWLFVALVEAEAHINPSPAVLQTQVWSAAVLWILHFLLQRAKPHK